MREDGPRASPTVGGGRCSPSRKWRDLAEDPGPPLRGAADHHRIGAGAASTLARFSGVSMSPLAITGMRHRGLDGADRVVLDLAGEAAGARPAVDGERGTPRPPRFARCAPRCGARGSQPVRIFSVTGTSTRATTASRIAATSGSSLQQRRARHDVADLLCRATHVDVDDLRAALDVVARGFGHHGGSAPAICTTIGSDFAGVVGAAHATSGAPELRIRRDHLRHRIARAESLAQLPERPVGDARHGRDEQIVRDVMGPIRTLGIVAEAAAGDGLYRVCADAPQKICGMQRRTTLRVAPFTARNHSCDVGACVRFSAAEQHRARERSLQRRQRSRAAVSANPRGQRSSGASLPNTRDAARA